MARGVAERINASVLDKLKVVRRTRDQVELSAQERRVNVAGAYASWGPVGRAGSSSSTASSRLVLP